MIWLLLVPASAVLCLTALLSYSPAARAAWWFLWLLPALGAANVIVWCWACRRAADNRQLFSLSVAWDVVGIVAYSALPLIVFGIRLSPVAWCGLGLVVAGAFLVKWGG